MKYKIEISWSEEDLAYVAMVAELPGCTATGASESEAQAKIQHAIDAWLAAGRAMNKERAAVQTKTEVEPKPKAKKVKSSRQFSLAEAAVRQINAAISLFFAHGDPVVVHTLALAAGRVFARLLDKARAQGRASLPAEGLALSRPNYLALLARSEGFFQADDPARSQGFDDLDDLIALAVADGAEIQVLSKEMQAFQTWYRAVHAQRFGPQPCQCSAPLEMDTGLSVSGVPSPAPLVTAPSLPRRRKLALGLALLNPSPAPMQFSLLP